MTVLLALVGLLLGGVAGGLVGLLAGGVIGFLVGQQLDLRKRLKKLEETQSRVDEIQSWATEMKAWAQQTHAWLMRLGPSTQPAEAQPDTAAQPDAEPAPEAEPAAPPESPGVAPVVRPVASEPSTDIRAPVPGPATPAPPDASTRASRPREPAAVDAPAPADARVAPDAPTAATSRARERPSDPVSWVANWIKQWVTTGNAPVKVGVLVSLVGVGLLLREAHRRGIIELTIEVRLAAAAVFGLVMLAVGWRQRRSRPIYGVSLQGGGVAVLYLTTYAAFVVYDVVGAVPAAAAVVIVTVGAGVLSVLQDSRVLAVLGIIGGFLAPVLTYSRPDDHVYVFTFFLVLNAAIIGVAWFKTWPELNLLGFGFTFGLTFFWLVDRFEQDEWVSTQPFIALFVLMYMGLPALFAAREAPDLKTVFDGSRVPDMAFVRGAWTAPLVFGTPFAGLGLQQLAAGHTDYGLAITAAGLAVIQAALGLTMRRLGADGRQLAEAYAGLGVAFSAIAVPLALEAYFTSTVWAAQGLFLLWLGCRRDRLLALTGGAVLQVLAAVSFAQHLGESLPYPDGAWPIANQHFLGALLLAVAGLASGRLLSRRPQQGDGDQALVWTALGWGVVWWLVGGVMEIVQQLPDSSQLSAVLGFMVGSFAAGSLGARRLRWQQLESVGLLILPTLVLMLVLSLLAQSHPLDEWGWAAWPPAFAAHYLVLRRREGSFPRLAALVHTGGYWTLAALAAAEVYWQVDRVAEGVWPLAATVAAALALASATMAGRRRLAWPVAAHWRTYLLACAGPLLAVLAVVVLGAAVSHDGDPTPLLFLPVVNPLGVLIGLQLAALLAWRRLAGPQPDHPFEAMVTARWAPALAVLGLVLATVETARAVSHWMDVPWELDALWDATELQTSLSILWAVIGLSGMVAGVRMARRAVWVAGASWMAVVVVKLFLVDLSSLTALGRVVSFIVVGVLLLIVGYLAPVPPAAAEDSEDSQPV
ncbi:MAG: DUF2339 domain-containing protein [Acidimicrobiaceae bacterium]|nr:DUF2339 domain-containing protein [Acidimicrobiaceae bacterium]